MSSKLDTHLIIVVGIIISAGGFGGLLNYLHNFDTYNEAPENNSSITKYVLLGIGAAFLVPAFLKMISSNLLNSPDNNDLLIFAGFCLVASIFSKRFINTIGEKILEAAKQAEKTSNENKRQLKTTQLELTSTKERIEDVKLAMDIKNSEDINLEKVDEDSKSLLIDLANTYIEKTSIPDYSKRIKLKAELGRRMGEIIIRNNLIKEDLLESNQSEGMLMALSYSIILRPGNEGLSILNKISKLAIQLYTRYSILVAYDTLTRNNFINKSQIINVYSIIKEFRNKADEPLMRKINESIDILGIINPEIKG